MIEILFEDDYIILVNKPAMVLSQPSFDKKRIPIKDQLEQQRPDLVNKLYLHHRLDFETSGVFLISKSTISNAPLTLMFQNHEFEKNYLCLVKPHQLKAGKKVQCEIIHQESEWIIKNYMAPAKGVIKHKKRMISVKSGGWPAETHFKVLQKWENYFSVLATPKTGRTHQIRQHLQESSMSIMGDNIYGGSSNVVPRLMLHAWKLTFKHPHFKNIMTVEAPLPKDFVTLLK